MRKAKQGPKPIIAEVVDIYRMGECPQPIAVVNHRCFILVAKKLEEKNTKLRFATEMLTGAIHLVIASDKIRRGPSPAVVTGHFCPFCGERLSG